MIVQVNTDNHVEGTAKLHDWAKSEIEDALGRFEPQMTRAEVYLSDMNSHKEGQVDKQCTLEVHVAGLTPIAVTKEAGTLDAALDLALEVMTLTLDSRLDKIQQKKGRMPMGGEAGV